MSENWTIDEYGFCTNEKIFFNVCDMKSLDKIGEYTLKIGFFASIREITWGSPSDRDKFYDLFSEKMREIKRQDKEHCQYHHNYQEAVLATQKSIINGHIGVIK